MLSPCWGARHNLGKTLDGFLLCAHPSALIRLNLEPGEKTHLEAEAGGLQVQGQLQAQLGIRALALCVQDPGFHPHPVKQKSFAQNAFRALPVST